MDDQYGGVLLLVDYSLSDPALAQPLSSPFACTLYRSTPDGTVARVRGGDPYVNYGKQGFLYDQEGPLNTLTTYWAVPRLQDGTDGPPCGGVQVQTSDPRPDMWLTTPDRPNAAVNVPASDSRKVTLPGRSDLQTVLGSANPSATLEVRGGPTTTMQFYTRSQAEFEAVLELIKQNIIFRKSTTWERTDGWFLIADAGYEPATGIYTGWFLWTLALTATDRPGTTGQFVSIPGHTLADRQNEFPFFNNVIQRQFSGNLLLEEDSTFNDLVQWTADANTTVSQDMAAFREGSASMKLVATAAGSVASLAPYNVPIKPGHVYEYNTWAYSPQSGRTVNFEVDWKDSAGAYISDAESDPLALAATQWTKVRFRAVAPMGATQATLLLVGTATASADSFNFDVVSFGPLP